MSFLGELHEVDFSGAQPSIRAAVVAGEPRRARRTGVRAASRSARVHRKLGRLYVPMHQGGEGSHKEGGSEIWVFDTATHRAWRAGRSRRSAAGADVLPCRCRRIEAPVLFAATANADVVVLDALSGQLRHIEKHLGQTPWMMLNP